MVRKKIQNKKAAMEMTVGTIVTIVLLMSALVLGLVLTRTIFSRTTENVINIDEQVKTEINQLFQDSGSGLVILVGNQNTARVKAGTANFGIPIAFSPKNSGAWGTENTGCTYRLVPVTTTGTQYCNSKATGTAWAGAGTAGITNICKTVKTGCGSNANLNFDVENKIGYALIKIDIPEGMPPCLQRFTVSANCAGNAYTNEVTSKSFDIEVINKGLFG